MTSISNVNPAALLILQQTSSVSATTGQKNESDDLLVVANGQANKVSSSKQPTQAASKISESLFSVNHQSVTQMKLDLIERTGKALGIDQTDYASADEFVSAMRDAVSKIRTQDDGQQIIAKIEKDLGLDKLGVSLDDVINSARDPEADDKVTEALEKKADKTDDDKQVDGTISLLGTPDEIGLYSVIR